MVGQFGFGRAGRSHDTGYVLTGDVHGLLDAPPAFVARHDVAIRRVAQQLDTLAAQAAACPLVPARVAEISTLLAETVRGS